MNLNNTKAYEDKQRLEVMPNKSANVSNRSKNQETTYRSGQTSHDNMPTFSNDQGMGIYFRYV